MPGEGAAPRSRALTPRDLALVLLSALLHASWNAATRGSRSPTAFVLGMELASLVVFLPVVLWGVDFGALPARLWPLIVATGITHSFYAYWLTRAYTHAELSVVYPIARSTPALVPLVAVPLFGEPVTPGGAAGIALVVAGMWAVATDGSFRLRALASPGAAYAWLTLLATVAYSLVDKEGMRVLSTAEDASRLPVAFVFMILLYCFHLPGFALLSLRKTKASELWEAMRGAPGAIAVAALVSLVSYALVLEAFRTAPVSYVVAVRQTSVLFAVFLGIALLRERPHPARVAGAAANVAGVALIALYG